MFVTNVPTIARMAASGKSLALLWKTLRYFRADPEFRFGSLVRAMMNSAKGEKIVAFRGNYVVTSFLPPLGSKAFQSVITAVPRKKGPFGQQMRAERSAPISLFMAVTDECQYNCIHCSAAGRRKGAPLSTGEWKRVIRGFQDMGVAIIGITGGEPLLRKDILEIVGSIDDRSVSILYTNGRFMDARTARALSRAGLFAAGVSFDSHVPEKLNSMRGDGRAFEYACAAVRNARAAGLYTIVQTVVLKSDLSRRYLFGLFRLAKRLGAHEVRILEPIASGHLLAAGDAGDVFYAPRDRRRLIRIQYAANRRPGFPKVTTFAHTESARQYGCGAGTQHSYVTASGELLPCDFVPLSFGSVLAREPAVLWREMNAAIGIPKSRCLAQDLAPTLVHHGAEGLPLGRERSEEICRSCRQSRYPWFYGYLQGN